MCLAHGHNSVMRVKLEPTALRSRVKLSTTEPLCSLFSILSASVLTLSSQIKIHQNAQAYIKKLYIWI